MKMKSNGFDMAVGLACLALCAWCQDALGRQWTNDQGKAIEADYVSSDGSSVILNFRGKQVTYDLARLSEADREFVSAQLKDTGAADDIQTGWVHDFSISKPAFPEIKGYLKSRNAKAAYKAFDSGEFPDNWKTNKKDAAAEFAYENGRAIVYVPASYDGSKPYGVYVHISPGENGENLAKYAPVMDRLKMIYVSPKGSSNHQPMLRRVKLAVDALASVQSQWKTDPKRTCVGGLSGGGHMSMLTHAMFPEMFVASVSHAAQSYLPVGSSYGHFPGLDVGDLKSRDLKGHKWCVISGNKDNNYQEIIDSSKAWDSNRIDYRFFDIPNMGHTNAMPEHLEEALKWIGM